jgi:AcrR family transcriptional regulator
VPRSAPPVRRRPQSGRASARPRPRRGGPRSGAEAVGTRRAIFTAAADLFSRRGFDGVVVDDIARAARVNKAMLYYHFADKLGLYREIVEEMLREAGARMAVIADGAGSPEARMARFVAEFVALADERPYFPTLMMREIAEGALHLDADTLALMRVVFLAFCRILADGQERRDFREVQPVLAYMTVLGPVLLNAARERAAAQPGRKELPMFVRVPHADLTRHMQDVAARMLRKDS